MYSRKIDGQVLTLAASGWTYDNTFVLYDRETESMWYPLGNGSQGLTCISGVFADRVLPELPAKRLRWFEWASEQPGSKYMRCKSQNGLGCAGY